MDTVSNMLETDVVDAALHAAESILSGDSQLDVPDIISSGGISEESPSRLLQGSRESAQHSNESTSSERDAYEEQGGGRQRQRMLTDARAASRSLANNYGEDEDTPAALEVDSVNREEVDNHQAALDVDDIMGEELPTRTIGSGSVAAYSKEADGQDALDVDSLSPPPEARAEDAENAEAQADNGRAYSRHSTTPTRMARIPVSSAIHTLEHRNVTPMCKATVYVERVPESLQPASAVDIDDLPATPSEVMVCAAAEVSRSVAAATAVLEAVGLSSGVLLETGTAPSQVLEKEWVVREQGEAPARVEGVEKDEREEEEEVDVSGYDLEGVEKDEREEEEEVDVPGYDFTQPPRFKQWLPTPSYDELQSARGGSRENL